MTGKEGEASAEPEIINESDVNQAQHDKEASTVTYVRVVVPKSNSE